MSQILACYKTILNAFSLVEQDDSLISQMTPTGVAVPLKVDGRRLVLPTKEWLKKGFGEDYLPFHPLCEVMSREGTSPVVQMLQRQAKAVIIHNTIMLTSGLLKVAVDKDTHKDLPIECTDFLKKLASADEATVTLFEKLVAAAGKKNRLLTVYLKNGGKFDGKKVNRSAIIRFPIMEDLQSDSKDVLGIVIPKKQRPTLIALFKLVVPFGDNAEEYSYGTTTRVAPYFTALLHAYHKISTVLNQSIHTYGEKLHLPVKSIELFELSSLDSFAKIYNELPSFNGNEGSTNDQPEEASETNVAKPVTPIRSTVEPSNPVKLEQLSRSTNPVAASVGNGSASMADFMAATTPAPQYPNYTQPQPAMTVAIPVNGFNQPTGFNGFPQPNNGYAPVSFNAPQNAFAPSNLTPPWEAQRYQQQQVNSNPFMSATMSGRVGGNGSIGLV